MRNLGKPSVVEVLPRFIGIEAVARLLVPVTVLAVSAGRSRTISE